MADYTFPVMSLNVLSLSEFCINQFYFFFNRTKHDRFDVYLSADISITSVIDSYTYAGLQQGNMQTSHSLS